MVQIPTYTPALYIHLKRERSKECSKPDISLCIRRLLRHVLVGDGKQLYMALSLSSPPHKIENQRDKSSVPEEGILHHSHLVVLRSAH